MQELFTTLSHAVSGSLGLALAASALWGVLSLVLSPCHLSSIPLIVGFIDGQGRISTARSFYISLLFAVGILITIAALGAVTAASGRIMGDVGPWGNYVVAIIFLLVGLYLMEVISLPLAGPSSLSIKRRGPLAAFILGLVFGIALGPCTFAYMAPVLGVVFRSASTDFLRAALLLLVYGIGHCVIIVLAGTYTSVVQRYLNWNERSSGAVILRRVCGVLVIMGGVWLIYTA